MGKVTVTNCRYIGVDKSELSEEVFKLKEDVDYNFTDCTFLCDKNGAAVNFMHFESNKKKSTWIKRFINCIKEANNG